jgi:Icc-related predicted phosphoesterase
MHLLFTTDLHGSTDKYNRVLDIAHRNSVAVVINGGDMFPYGRNPLRDQKRFIEEFLDPHFSKYDELGIHYLCMTGNDDLAANDALFDSMISRHPKVRNIAQNLFASGGYEFIGMNRVADFPFRLKDRARMDSLHFAFPRQFGTALLSQPTGEYKEILDWQKYARALPTIEDELELLPRPSDYHRAIYVIHMPPAMMGLDVCIDGQKVGSKAIYEFIRARQPLLTLHGHIHESPDISGIWKATIDKTLCVQPGQSEKLKWVTIDLESMSIQKFIAE